MKKFLMMFVMLIVAPCFGAENVDWDCTTVSIHNLTDGEGWVGKNDLIPGVGTGGAYCELDEEYLSYSHMLRGGFSDEACTPPMEMGSTITNIDVKYTINFDHIASDKIRVMTKMAVWDSTFGWQEGTTDTKTYDQGSNNGLYDVVLSKSPSSWGCSEIDIYKLMAGHMRVSIWVENYDTSEDGGDLDVYVDDLNFSAQD